MRRLPLAVLLLLAAAAPPAGTPVPLRAQAGSPLDAAARRLMAAEIKDAQDARQRALVLVGTAPLAGPGKPEALVAQLQTPYFCGSGGCTTRVFVRDGAAWRQVLDGLSVSVTVLHARHRGMADLQFDRSRWVWNGREYRAAR